jgi:hypothetical protein
MLVSQCQAGVDLQFQRRQHLVHNRPDRAQRMISRHPRVKVNVAEQLARSIVAGRHPSSPNLVGPRLITAKAPRRTTFQ